eukprot:TRINITY_DN33466_c0_g1_i5.p1 TRINITY_DN33466_c0_g1~~TRINITY_DN33466_c0_g1_i5.p1  ORF type:complete len:489 (-),score=87.10 TRINITY_DN33466_c0_g1_i5:592-2058(-)
MAIRRARRSLLQVSAWLCATVASRLGAFAEILKLEDTKIPSSWSVRSVYFFYVYSQEDTPAADTPATITFSNLELHGNNSRIAREAPVQVSLIPLPPGRGTLYPEKPGEPDVINSTSVYALLISNCGRQPLSEISLSGEVSVKNPFGYLPGTEYPKLGFYTVIGLVYAGLLLLWLLLSLVHCSVLFNIHWCIFAVLLFGLMEAVAWFTHYSIWNDTGVRPMAAFIASVLLSVAKNIFSYMLVFVGSLGWGITKPLLSTGEICKVICFCVSFIVLDSTNRIFLAFWHSREIPQWFVLAIRLPIALLNSLIFYSVFTALANTMESLKAKGQTEKLRLFEHLWRVLMVALLVATGSTFYEVFSVTRSIEDRWKTLWILADGVAHCLFLFVLVGMMVLWRPHSESQRYAYSAQLDDQDLDPESNTSPSFSVSAAVKSPAPPSNELKDDDDEDDFWDLPPMPPSNEPPQLEHGSASPGMGANKVEPDVLGARS